MPSAISLSSLIPAGLSVERFEAVDRVLFVTASARTPEAACPSCGSPSRRWHSRYVRNVSDLPSAGRSVRLLMITRRFRCGITSCRRKIFAERFGDEVVAQRARRTGRMECLVHHLSLALGGRPAACFAQRLMMPVSNDTLLRVVRRRARSPRETLNVVGIDDFAFRRNHRYGSIVCDLERRCHSPGIGKRTWHCHRPAFGGASGPALAPGIEGAEAGDGSLRDGAGPTAADRLWRYPSLLPHHGVVAEHLGNHRALRQQLQFLGPLCLELPCSAVPR